MGSQHTDSGLKAIGEDAAASLLVNRGYQLLHRNWRTRFGELDIVAMDGSTLVFVEVKARTSGGLVAPQLAVDHKKRRQLKRLAEAYVAWEAPRFLDCRFDVVAVVSTQGRLQIEHLPSAF